MLLSVVQKISQSIIIITVFLMPLFFLPMTTDYFELPKQILLVSSTLVLLILFCLSNILAGMISYRRNPFNLGLITFFITILVSSLLAAGQIQILIKAIPILSIILFTFLIINMITSEKEEKFLILTLLLSALILAIFTILEFLKLYILPLSGSLLTSVLFFAVLIPLGFFQAKNYFKQRKKMFAAFFIGATMLITIGLGVGFYQLATTAKPILLPYKVGLRTALSPLGLNFQTAFFGTGPGTYAFNFTRFRNIELNTTSLWNLRFTNSSSFFLEILPTLGTLGAASMSFIAIRFVSSLYKTCRDAKTIGVSISLFLAIVFSFLFPYSFLFFFTLFLLLALYTTRLTTSIHITTSIHEATSHYTRSANFIPFFLFFLSLLLSLVLFYNMARLISSDITFQQSISSARDNNIKKAYNLQKGAIREFPHSDRYHKTFSQTNMAIANSIVSNANKGETLTDQDKQTVTNLVRQSINSAQNAVLISPLDVANWENLSSIYRNLIGFARNADNFALTSTQQAITLDPTNPLLRINLGGIFLQIGSIDDAIYQFQIAANLKRDFANAYYNLGNAYEVKGDKQSLKAALAAYQTTQILVQNSKNDLEKINDRIASLQAKLLIDSQKQATLEAKMTTSDQESLQISTSSAALLKQKLPVAVEGPPSGKKD